MRLAGMLFCVVVLGACGGDVLGEWRVAIETEDCISGRQEFSFRIDRDDDGGHTVVSLDNPDARTCWGTPVWDLETGDMSCSSGENSHDAATVWIELGNVGDIAFHLEGDDSATFTLDILNCVEEGSVEVIERGE